jgi:hypothetical protein
VAKFTIEPDGYGRTIGDAEYMLDAGSLAAYARAIKAVTDSVIRWGGSGTRIEIQADGTVSVEVPGL